MATATKQKWTVLARHRRWVQKCTITESVLDCEDINTPTVRRFTATIDGWQGFRLFQGTPDGAATVQLVIQRAKDILARIEAGDDSVFTQLDFTSPS